MAIVNINISEIKFLPKPTHFRFRDLTDQTFTRLTVKGIIDFDTKHRPIWLCQCICGNWVRTTTNQLTSGNTKSCSCLQKEINIRRLTKHGKSHTSEYIAWKQMRKRCQNPADSSFHNYGERGITICDKWQTFEGFYEDMGERPEGMTVERQDNELGYSLDNCVWGNRTIQARNKRTTLQITYQNRTQPLAVWCEELNLTYEFIYHRLHRGWTPEQAFTLPFMTKLRRTP